MATTFLRETQHPPRASQFLAIHADNLDLQCLQSFIDDVWADLLARFADPIKVTRTRTRRIVEVLGTIRYCVDKATGQISIEELVRGKDDSVTFMLSKAIVSVDLPCLPNGGWIEGFLLCRWTQMGEVLIDHGRCGAAESWLSTVKRILWAAVRRSTYWRKLRHALHDALELDSEVLGWCRHGRSRHVNHVVTNRQYNEALSFRFAYEVIARDNPNLIWLYTFMLEEKINLPFGDPIWAMKTWLTKNGITPAGWRLLANGCERDFAHVRDWIGPEGELDGRDFELVSWLRFIPKLKRQIPLRGALQKLFLHDSFKWTDEGKVRFRNVDISLPTFNILLAEAERRQKKGSLKPFINEDLVEVMTWLEAEHPEFDKNQIKSGWNGLAKQAVNWKVECEAYDTLFLLRWESCLPAMEIGSWTVLPLTDAWQLREDALRQHHCADRYVQECLSGGYRLFSVRNAKGKRVATIGIELKGDEWKSFGIRGVANAAVEGALQGMDKEVAERYTDLWRLEQAAQPMTCGEPAPYSHEHFKDMESADCPFCERPMRECEEHIVALYELSEGWLVGGHLYTEWERLRDLAEESLRQALAHNLVDTGLGQDIDVCLRDTRKALACGQSAREARDNIGRHRWEACVLDLLLEQSAVDTFFLDYGGFLSGTSRYYIAEDPAQVIAVLEHRLTDNLNRIRSSATAIEVSEGDTAVLGHLENRLDVTVDRDDPMLPAIIAMERALMKEFEARRTP